MLRVSWFPRVGVSWFGQGNFANLVWKILTIVYGWRRLRLWGMQITDEALRVLAGMPLSELGLVSCNFLSDAGLVHLQKLPLRRLRVWGCKNVTPAGVEALKLAVQVRSLNPFCS